VTCALFRQVATYDPSVLLVGREFHESSAIANWFLNRRRGCLIASTVGEVSELSKLHNFDLILSNYQLPDGAGSELIDRFPGLPVSLFLSHRIEDGCIWLPAILCGVKCWGSCSLKPRAFVRLLADILSGHGGAYLASNYLD